jgi:uncharacterized protein involved in type VI secretion and phage assembly
MQTKSQVLNFTSSLIATGVLLTLVGCGGGGANAPQTSTNTAPIASAGNPQSLMVGSTVTLDGSSSTDADHDSLTYNWSLTSKPTGSTANLSSTTAVNPTFHADLPGTYMATLMVNDGQATSSAATVTITAAQNNAAPVANAGGNQNVVANNTVTLDGSASSDANADALTYNWTLTSKPTGSSATLSSPTSARPTFTADFAGTYVASLTVNDGQVNSNVATVTVTAARANAAPVANAGTAQSVVAGTNVTLDGSASSDANGDALTYNWSLTSKPTGSSATLSSATSARPTFTADVAGTYVASLSVNDGQVSSNTATVSITATRANAAPLANAGTAQSVVIGNSVTLDGSASSDANGDALTYNWSLTSKPTGSTASLSSATSARPTFTADVAGTYVASLSVNDGQVSSNPATVSITASRANAAPVANAGTAQSVVAGNSVTLDGSASSDANGDALTYSWSLTSKPTGSTATLTSSTSVRPTFTADAAGTYVASLTVNDGQVSSDTTTVSITAITPSLSLYEISDSFFGGGETLQALPYSASANVSATVSCVGSGCTTYYKVGTFKLTASAGRSFTITNLTASNLTAGSLITPTFGNLTINQVIAAGQSVSFELRSPFTNGQTVNLRYSFTVQETGQTFSYSVGLRTN